MQKCIRMELREGRGEGGERGSRSTIHYLQDSLVPLVKPGPPSAPEYLIDCKIKVAKFPEILSLVLVTESLVWSSTGTLVVSGFMHHSVQCSTVKARTRNKKFPPGILWAEMTPLDRWKYCLKMWEISIKIISQDLLRKIDLWSAFTIPQENLIIIVLFGYLLSNLHNHHTYCMIIYFFSRIAQHKSHFL